MKIGARQSQFLADLEYAPITLPYKGHAAAYRSLAGLVNRGLADLDFNTVDHRSRMLARFTITQAGIDFRAGHSYIGTGTLGFGKLR